MSSGIEEWIVTFGSQYGTTEEHPVSKKIHRDGYVVVEAQNMEHARFNAHKCFKQAWSFLYSPHEWKENDKTTPNDRLFPLGEIGRINENGVLTIYGESV